MHSIVLNSIITNNMNKENIKKINCCEFLLHEIAFYKNTIRPCCSFSIEDDGDITPFVNNFNGNVQNISTYFDIRNNFIKTFYEGNKPVCYNGCTIFQNSNDDSSIKLTNIVISHRTKCSCNCFYCEQSYFQEDKEVKKALLNSRVPYDIKPSLKFLMDNNYIAEGCRFLICGGECSEYPKDELSWLIYFILSNQGKILFLSSGINYCKEIEQALKISDSVFKVSVDSGTKETYEKIKQIKAYDRVWNNIKQYIANTKKYKKGKIELKYILIPDVNDNKKEIEAFVSKCREVECETIVLDIEHKWLAKNREAVKENQNVKDCLNYFFDLAGGGGYMPKIFVSIEGVEEPLIWSLIDLKYNYKQEILNGI